MVLEKLYSKQTDKIANVSRITIAFIWFNDKILKRKEKSSKWLSWELKEKILKRKIYFLNEHCFDLLWKNKIFIKITLYNL